MDPQLKTIAAGQGNVFSRAQAIACGYSAEQIQRRLNDTRWRRIRYGQYLEAIDRGHLKPWVRRAEEHLESVHALLNSLRSGSVAVSHQSALLLHRLPIYGLDVTKVQVTRMDSRTRSLRGVDCHAGMLTSADLTKIDGLLVTTPSRAVFETSCRASFESAVVVADAALRHELLSSAEIARLLTATAFWPGSPIAREAIQFADRRSESVGESRLRVLMAAQGLPKPELQVDFGDAGGRFARVDFYFAQFRTVVEFDGLVKYGDAAAEVVMREKAREDRLRALGLEVVRVTWADLASPVALAERIRQAFARSRAY